MADKKITQLTNITGANLVDADEFVVVDISADETKAITLGELKEAFDSGSGFVRTTGDTMTGDLALSGADVTFGDNDKAIFGGATSELQIYSDGSQSFIEDTGTGDLRLASNGSGVFINKGTSENMAKFLTDGAVELYYDQGTYATYKLATTSTGIDVTGEITADGLTVDNNGTIQFNDPQATDTILIGTNDNELILRTDDGDIALKTNENKQQLRVANNGDISFYDSLGSSQSFFWDAADERLGIGTSFPSAPLDIKLNTTSTADIFKFQRSDGLVAGVLNYNGTDGAISFGTTTSHDLTFDTNNTERLRISSSGDLEMTGGGSVGWANWTITESGGSLYFATGGTNKMKLDASGNLDVVGSVNSNATIS